MPDVDDDLLTVDDIARILKLNPQTVRNWIDRGELPALRIGRRVRIRRADFDAMIEAGYSGPRQPPPPAPEGTIWDGVIPPPPHIHRLASRARGARRHGPNHRPALL